MPKYTASATYTDAELLEHFRECLVAIAVKGQEFEFEDRIYTRADLDEVRKTITWLESRVNAASVGMVVNLARRVRDC
jgi:hypothetical protein